MGYKDAMENHIRIQNRGSQKFYYPLCQYCSCEVKSPFYDATKKYTCNTCKMMTDIESKAEETKDVKDKRFETAIMRISGDSRDMQKYEKAIDTVRKVLYRNGWFASTEEVMVAIELIKNGYRINHQVPIKRYKLDFVLQDQKLVLEIDGPWHTEKTKVKEQLRDDIAIASFGPDWEVLRISTNDLNTNISRLTKAIESVIEKRKKYRESNNGQLPNWYNDREKYSDKKKAVVSSRIPIKKDY